MATTSLPSRPRHEMAETTPDGRLRLHFHPGQKRAFRSRKRFVLVLAGTQSGKTSFGPHWLYREVQRRGAGDYLVVAPTYPLLARKALPEFLKLFKRQLNLGRYVGSPTRRFVFSPEGEEVAFGGLQPEPTVVHFVHAGEPDALESVTAKAAWLDEAGQKRFRLLSWEAVQRRLAIHTGRCLLTTTPYDLGWLKQRLWDPWRAAGQDHPDIDVVRFDSTQNPAFPREEWERAQREMPLWRFNLYFRALFDRPAGMIYDSFDPKRDACPRFRLPAHWPRFVGMDFGPVNTAAVFYASEPGTPRLFAYRTYHPREKLTPEAHAKAILSGEPCLPTVVGGAPGEHEWRDKFRAAGLPVREPYLTSVEVGIDAVYAAHARGEIMVFDDLAEYLDEKATYSYEVDERGEPTGKIEAKASFHLQDAERYLIGWLRRPAQGQPAGGGTPRTQIVPGRPGPPPPLPGPPPRRYYPPAGGPIGGIR